METVLVWKRDMQYYSERHSYQILKELTYFAVLRNVLVVTELEVT